MPLVKDMMGRMVKVPDFPGRILSLVPSQTELLFDLGLGPRIAGITKFCVHPENARISCTIIGGTKTIHYERLQEIKPDLIIGNKEENEELMIQHLEEKYPIWISDIYDLEDAWTMIHEIGRITNTVEKAQQIVQSAQESLRNIPPVANDNKLRAAYLIWKSPWMGVGRHTFIHSMLEVAGFENALGHLERYPELTDQDLKAINPDVVLLSSEPFPFTEKHHILLKALLPGASIYLVNGEFFSWYGSRLIQAPNYFLSLRKEISWDIW